MAKHKKKNHRNGAGHRGANGGSVPHAGSPRPPRPKTRRHKPSFWTATSAIAGGVAGAAATGFAARKGYDPRWVGAALAGIGGLGAWKLDGGMRLASYGLAAAGAGASALEFLDKDEDKATAKPKPDAKKESPEKVAFADAGATAAPHGLRGARNGGGLDRAFNRVRDRLHRIYEDDDHDARVSDDEV